MSKKIVIPEKLRGDELHKFLVENKDDLINQKKSLIKQTDVMFSMPNFFSKESDGKKAILMPAEDADSILVKMVCNACNWCDSHMDVLLDNSAKRTIQQRKGMIPHLANHTWQLEAQVGDVEDVYLEQIPLKDLGLKESGATQCIIMESMVRRLYNEKVFNLYKKGKVNQHSIGLNYIEIYLAINQPENEYYEKEFNIWKKYYDVIINKDVVDEYGFFWAVKQIKLLENSGVLFGSNELTPTLPLSAKNHSPETALEAPAGDPEQWDMNVAIMTHKFF